LVVNVVLAYNMLLGSDTNQVAMKMTKESQQTIQDPTKDLIDPTRGDGHKPEHQLFFLRDRICGK